MPIELMNILSILMMSTPSLSMYDRPLWPVPTSSIAILHAEPLQRGDDPPRLGEVFDRLPLGDFEDDLRQLQRRLVEYLANVVDDFLVLRNGGPSG